MPHDHLEAARDAMWALSASERSAMLVASIAGEQRNADRFVAGLIALIERLCAGFGVARKWRVSELLRDAANRIELASGESEFHFRN